MAEAEHTFIQNDEQQNFSLHESDPRGFSGGEFNQNSIIENMHSEYGFVGNESENQGFAGSEQGITGNEQGFTGNDPEISYGVASEQNYPENESEHALDTNQGNEELTVSDSKQEFTENEANEAENVTENDNSQTQKKEVHENNVVGGSEKKWPGWPGESVFRMLIPVQKVGSVIGRKGEFIKKIVEETRSRVKVLEAPPGSQERAVMVSGRENPDASLPPAIEGLLRVHKRVVEGLDDDSSQAPPAGIKVSTKLLVPASQAGSLIGKQGATVKTIQETAGCMVRVLGQEDVPAFALQDDRVVEIAGDPANVHSALQLIASHLRKFLVDHSIISVFEKQMQTPSIPMEHMPSQPWGPPHGFPPTAGGGHGYVPTPQYMQPPPRQPANYYPTADMPPPPDRQHQVISAYGREPPLSVNTASGAQPAPAQSMITQVSQHMQVPLLYADAVIGTNGGTVSYIRRASGASVTIQESRGAPGEMTVEINGTASQVQAAQQLIQNFMADAGATTAPTQAGASTEQAYNQSYNSYAAAPASIYGSPASSATYATQPNAYGSVYGTNYGY